MGGYREKHRDRRRLEPALVIATDGATLVTTDWPLGGVLVSGYHGQRQQGEKVEAEVSAAAGADRYAFKATVVRRSAGSGRMILHFTEHSDGDFALLEGL